MKNSKLHLGIDTSNYTTSLALCDENGTVVANIKRILDVKLGEKGLRQSDAVFSHVKNLPELSSQLHEAIGTLQIASIGVSATPRDVEDSYMPCFLVGKAIAYSLGATHNAPVYEFSHQAGHVMAAIYSSGHLDSLINNDFIAFHVSGGTTEALYVKPNDKSFDISIIADTADISAGQAIDRAGVLMGMKFPCGREIEENALKYNGEIPKAKISVKNGKCNLSGVENIITKLYGESNDKEMVSAFVLSFVERTLVKLTEDIRVEYPGVPIIYAGGVMSNSIIKKALAKFENTYFAAPEFSSDNAAGVSLLARRSFNK